MIRDWEIKTIFTPMKSPSSNSLKISELVFLFMLVLLDMTFKCPARIRQHSSDTRPCLRSILSASNLRRKNIKNISSAKWQFWSHWWQTKSCHLHLERILLVVKKQLSSSGADFRGKGCATCPLLQNWCLQWRLAQKLGPPWIYIEWAHE